MKRVYTNSPLFCEKDLSDSYADYHQNMNGKVFENWFQSNLLPNVPKEKKVVIVLDNSKYHNRYVEKTPTMNMEKNDTIAFMINHGIEIPNPLPTKPVLLQKIRQANISKQFVIDIMAKEAGLSVLHLPPYYCVLNPIKIVWN